MRHSFPVLLAMMLGFVPPVVSQTSTLALHPGDAIRLGFKEEPTSNGDFAVDENGMALLPFLGMVNVVGRPFADVRTDLLAAYAGELVDPTILIIPLQRVAVLGEVRRPGLYPVDPTLALPDVLALAGGLTPNARSGRIAVVRDGRTVQKDIEPDADGPMVSLRSGDRIVVGRRSWLSENTPFLLGALSSVAAATVAALIAR